METRTKTKTIHTHIHIHSHLLLNTHIHRPNTYIHTYTFYSHIHSNVYFLLTYVGIMVHMWRSEDRFWEAVLFFHLTLFLISGWLHPGWLVSFQATPVSASHCIVEVLGLQVRAAAFGLLCVGFGDGAQVLKLAAICNFVRLDLTLPARMALTVVSLHRLRGNVFFVMRHPTQPNVFLCFMFYHACALQFRSC